MSGARRETLRSLQNPRVKEVVSLRSRRARERSGLTLVDGARELLRALDGGVVIEELFVCDGLVRSDAAQRALASAQEIAMAVQPVTDRVMAKLSFGERAEGLLAVVRWRSRTLEEIAQGMSNVPLLLVVEAIEKPGNLGALLRTADAAGVQAVIVCDPATDASNPNAVRASLGTLFTVPLALASASDASAWLCERGIRAVAVTPEAPLVYTSADLTGPLALVVGAEHAGLGPSWRAADVAAISIPMAGHADSLNVAAAATIVLFEAVRQRSAPGTGERRSQRRL